MPAKAEQCQTEAKKQAQQHARGHREITSQSKQTTTNVPIQIRSIPPERGETTRDEADTTKTRHHPPTSTEANKISQKNKGGRRKQENHNEMPTQKKNMTPGIKINKQKYLQNTRKEEQNRTQKLSRQ